MPLFDYLCLDCGQVSEIFSLNQAETPQCTSCAGTRLKKMLSATSSLSGVQTRSLPGRGDTSCCGSSPSHAGCAGPGSCCGKGGQGR